MQEGRLSAISADGPVVSDSAVKQLKHRIRELEHILGRKTLEIGILKEGVEISRSKKRIT
jgi:transposase